jgi:hypothetical protein
MNELRTAYGTTMVGQALDQLRQASGDLHVAAQHIPIAHGLAANEILAHFSRAELLLENLERALNQPAQEAPS